MSFSLNMIFWSVVVTVMYMGILVSFLKDKKKDTNGRNIVIGSTLFYASIMASIWIIDLDYWF